MSGGAIVRADPAPRPARQHRPRRNVPPAARRVVLDVAACFYCGDVLLPREVEHRVPLSRGGTNAISNFVAACVSCNSDKRGKHVHEWRAYRKAMGMPWPPLASHPTDPRHYCHSCRDCKMAHGLPWPEHRFVLAPHALTPEKSGRLLAHYMCPNSHAWTISWLPDDGYFSDCPCLFCWHSREDEGDEHYTRPLRWNEVAPSNG